MKTVVEWRDGDGYRQVRLPLAYTRHGNCMFKHRGKVYVLKDVKIGTEVVVNEAGKWTHAGRVARGCIFLGEGMSWHETNEKNFLDENNRLQVFSLARANPTRVVH